MVNIGSVEINILEIVSKHREICATDVYETYRKEKGAYYPSHSTVSRKLMKLTEYNFLNRVPIKLFVPNFGALGYGIERPGYGYVLSEQGRTYLSGL
ncbi:hypothetical protein [Shewanella sp. Isolate8]|uniref:hypothetical protein n=1 Tax=Shewanella sp. Isolate8 TaxID=2908529 RepID=UPI001EFEE480|nr:hypothetical protein [Shewanella sp. Isolate8]MCG9746517.1 hypothetical protein [Shewanella sp. Isolate8]